MTDLKKNIFRLKILQKKTEKKMNENEPRSQIVYDDPGSVTDIRKRFGQVKGESASQFR